MSAPMVGAFDPGRDREAQLVACVPALAVQCVLLRETEEGFPVGVFSSGADLVHGADHVVAVQRVTHLAGPKPRSAIGVQMHPVESPREAC